jgi:Leucine-rich repeat (LRR) protein
LNLAENFLNATIPKSFSKLTKLEKLWLGTNRLTGQLSDRVFSDATWAKLIALDLSQNQFTGKIPKSLVTKAKSLQTLYLESNRLTGTIPDVFQIPKTATTIATANDNEGSQQSSKSSSTKAITATSVAETVALGDLQVFDVGSNRLTGTLPTSWFSLPLLRDFNVAGNSLQGTIPTHIFQLSNLEVFVLVRTVTMQTVDECKLCICF